MQPIDISKNWNDKPKLQLSFQYAYASVHYLLNINFCEDDMYVYMP